MKLPVILAAIVPLLAPLALLAAPQAAAPVGGQAGRGGAGGQTWWVEKTEGGVYPAPLKPIWKLSDLKRKYGAQDSWREQIVLDPETDATYNSAAPGSTFIRRMYPDTNTLFVLTGGEMRFDVQGQGLVDAKRGSLVTVLRGTIVSYTATGTQNALWVEIHPKNYKAAYPGTDPAPAPVAGGRMTRVAFNRAPAEYTTPTKVHWNLFDAIATCGDVGGVHVNVEGIYSQANFGFADPNDPLNTCAPAARAGGAAPGAGGAAGRGGRGGAGRAGAAADEGPFDPKSVFGHLHIGPAEWWVVQVGHIRARFENVGEIIAEEGDVLFAAPMTWHQMGYVGAGPSCRLIISAYPFINMNSIPAGTGAQ